MENFNPNIPQYMKEDLKRNFEPKIPNQTIYPKSTLKTSYIKLPMHIQKEIFEFFNQREQIDFSTISKKFYRLFYLCSNEKESLVLNKNELSENYLYFVFAKFPIFKNVKKLYLHNIILKEILLEFLYKLDLKNLKKLKVINCSFVVEPEKTPISYGMGYSFSYGFSFANIFKIGLKLFEFIQRFKAYETFYLENFRFNVGQRDIPFGIPIFFPLGLPKLKKLVMKNCNLKSIQNLNNSKDIYKRFPSLEVIDFSENPINTCFFNDAMLAIFFPNSEKMKKVILNNCQMNLNSIKFTYLQNFCSINTDFKRTYPNYKILDVSNNNVSADDIFQEHEELLKKIFPNLLIKKDNLKISTTVLPMRMLLPTSSD